MLWFLYFIPKSHHTEFLNSLFNSFLWVYLLKVLYCFNQMRFKLGGRFVIIPVCTTHRLRNDLIDKSEIIHVVGSKFQLFSCFFFLFPRPPQNGTAVFGRYNSVPCIFEHEHTIAYTNAQCTSGCTFTDYHAYHRHFQPHHLIYIPCYRFSLTAFFCFETRICTWSIYESNYRLVEFFSKLHQPEGLAVTFRIGHSEITELPHLSVAAFLLSYHHNCLSIQRTKSTYHRFIILHIPVAK